MSVVRRLQFGFSPCPNDTFAFWGAVHGMAPAPFALEPVLADIEALNARALGAAPTLPVTKLSLPAFARASERYVVLAAGAALGFGCGPLVVCRDGAPFRSLDDLATARLAIPGAATTAWLLCRLLATAPPREVVPMRFDEVMPAVARGACDAGLVIHESRFTYRAHGLREVADLGVLWERATDGPLPLGVIAAHRALGPAVHGALGAVLRASVRLARGAPDRPREYVRAHARELADDVCDRHIALYVNDFTEDLGERGRRAIVELLARSAAAGLLPPVVDAFAAPLAEGA